jgi:uncharacterized membrane protein YkvA (DUF1232 family)
MQAIYTWYRNTLRNPKYRWWIVFGTIAYLVMPFDFLPDFIPFVGELDDVAVFSLLVAEISQIVIEKIKSRQPETPTEVANADGVVDVDSTPVSE